MMASDLRAQRRPDVDDRRRKYRRRWKQKANGSRPTDMFLKEGAFEAGMVNGMIKIAATMSEIRGAAKRIGHEAGSFQGQIAAILPTKRQYKQMLETKSGRGLLAQNARASGVKPRQLAKNVRSAIKTPEYKQHAGKIFLDKDALRETLPSKKKPEMRDVMSIFNVHEGFERKSRPSPGSGHISNKVLMDEKNLINKLKGRGSKNARAYMERLRGPEHEHLKGQMMRRYKDPRVLQYLKSGRKIPAAMKRDMLRGRQVIPNKRLRESMYRAFEMMES